MAGGEKRVGITISVRDRASKAIENLAKNANNLERVFTKAAGKIQEGFKSAEAVIKLSGKHIKAATTTSRSAIEKTNKAIEKTGVVAAKSGAAIVKINSRVRKSEAGVKKGVEGTNKAVARLLPTYRAAAAQIRAAAIEAAIGQAMLNTKLSATRAIMAELGGKVQSLRDKVKAYQKTVSKIKSDTITRMANAYSKLSRKVKKAAKDIGALNQKFRRNVTAVKDAFAPLKRLAMGVFGVAAAFTAMIYKVADLGDKLAKTAPRVGFTTDQFQKLDHAMQISGTSMQVNRGSMTKFARTARDATTGVRLAADAFGMLGVSVKDNNGKMKDTHTLLLDVADAFSKHEDGVIKSALGMDLFGRSGAQLLQFLNLGRKGIAELGAEAQAYGRVLSGEVLQKSQDFIDALTRMKAALLGLTSRVAMRFMDQFSRVMESVAKKLAATDVDALVENIREAMSLISSIGIALTGAMLGVATILITPIAAVVTAIQAAFGGIMKAWGYVVRGIVDLLSWGLRSVADMWGSFTRRLEGWSLDAREMSLDAMIYFAELAGRGKEVMDELNKEKNKLLFERLEIAVDAKFGRTDSTIPWFEDAVNKFADKAKNFLTSFTDDLGEASLGAAKKNIDDLMKAFTLGGDAVKALAELSELLNLNDEQTKKLKEGLTNLLTFGEGKFKNLTQLQEIFAQLLGKHLPVAKDALEGMLGPDPEKNLKVLDSLESKLIALKNETKNLGKGGEDARKKILAAAKELGVIDDKMMRMLFDKDLFKTGLNDALSAYRAFITAMTKENKSFLQDSLEMQRSLMSFYSGQVHFTTQKAVETFRIKERLADSETRMNENVADQKLDLALKVAQGDMTSGEAAWEHQRNIFQKEKEMTQMREEASTQFYRSIRDAMIDGSVRMITQMGIEAFAKGVSDEYQTLSNKKKNAVQLADDTLTAGAKLALQTKIGSASILAFFAGMGPAGWLLAAGAVALFVASIHKIWSGAQGFAEGGYVTGGTQGKDSVRALLQPGEYVLSVNQVEEWKKLSRSLASTPSPANRQFAAGGPVEVQSAPQDNNLNIQFNSNQLPNRAETKRWIRSTLQPALKELNQQGMLSVGGI